MRLSLIERHLCTSENVCVDTKPSNQIGAATHAAIHQLNQSLKPEWLRVPDAVRVFAISRSALFEMIAAGTIKSASLKKRGALRGIRIISYNSLAEYCERAATQGGAGK